MRILITNDDGINAPGLNALKKIANKIADPDGEVWIVAPTSEKSGVGHCISLTKPILSSQLGPQKYAVDGNQQVKRGWFSSGPSKVKTTH